MKVCHIIWSMETGGAQHLIADIINEQCQTDEITLIVINDLIEEKILSRINNRVKKILINRPCGSKNIYYLIKLNLYILSLNPDYIHIHDKTILSLIPATWLIPAKKGRTVHAIGLLINNPKRYNDIFSISQSVYDDIFNRYSIKSRIIVNGINFDRLDKKNLNTTLPENSFKIVQIGRLDHTKKGQHLLIKALSGMKSALQAKITLTFIGDGPSKEYLIDLADSLNVANSCHFLGNQDKSFIYSNLKNFDLLVQPSIYEGFGLTVIEGIAAMVPVLVSDADGPYEIIQYGEYGAAFSTGSHEDLAKKIELFFDKTYRYNAFKKADTAFNACQARYDIKKTTELYLQAYRHSIVSR